jgi:hypothetical protein
MVFATTDTASRAKLKTPRSALVVEEADGGGGAAPNSVECGPGAEVAKNSEALPAVDAEARRSGCLTSRVPVKAGLAVECDDGSAASLATGAAVAARAFTAETADCTLPLCRKEEARPEREAPR